MHISSVTNTMQVEIKNERVVGLILDNYLKKCVLGYSQTPERILVKLKLSTFNISVIVVYGTPAHSTEEDILAYAGQRQG